MGIPVGQFHRRRYSTLGDWMEDCAKKIASYPASYVFAGSKLQFNAELYGTGSLVTSDTVRRNLTNALVAMGYVNVSVYAQNPYVGTATVKMSFGAPVDQASTGDVQSSILAALNGFGYQVVSTGGVTFESRPDVNTICSGSNQRPPVGSEEDLQPTEECGLGCQVGRLWQENKNYVLLGGALLAYVLIKR